MLCSLWHNFLGSVDVFAVLDLAKLSKVNATSLMILFFVLLCSNHARMHSLMKQCMNKSQPFPMQLCTEGFFIIGMSSYTCTQVISLSNCLSSSSVFTDVAYYYFFAYASLTKHSPWSMIDSWHLASSLVVDWTNCYIKDKMSSDQRIFFHIISANLLPYYFVAQGLSK